MKKEKGEITMKPLEPWDFPNEIQPKHKRKPSQRKLKQFVFEIPAAQPQAPIKKRQPQQAKRPQQKQTAAVNRKPVSNKRVAQKPVQKQAVHQKKIKRKQKKAYQIPQSKLFFGSSFVIILLLAGVITNWIEPKESLQNTNLPEQPAQQEASATITQIGPIRQENPTLTPITASLLKLPENGRVDMSYFDTALFIGDSLTQGFEEYPKSGFQNSTFAAYKGASPRTFIDGTVKDKTGEMIKPMDKILSANAQKIYLLLGTNSLENSTDDAFLKYYHDFLTLLLPQLPKNVVFYIQSIPPVSTQKAQSGEKFALSRIQNLNEMLSKMAQEHGVYYLDIYSALADETGALNPEWAAGDGLHMNEKGYAVWREYLITHTAYRPDSPYLPGSPYVKSVQ